MTVRTLALGLAVNRCAFGIGYLAAPASTASRWIGRAARAPGTGVFARALGARDLALGLGALRALMRRDDEQARVWLAAHALSDGTDLVATLAARRGLPRAGVAFASAMAAASTAIAVAGATALKSSPPEHAWVDAPATPGHLSPRDQERRDELLRLLKGAPTPEVSTETAARRIGIAPDEAERLVTELEAEGRLRREGERLIVVEPAASGSDRPLP